jgi:hypothetical protein
LARGDAKAAFEEARTAAGLDPRQSETTELAVAALTALGDEERKTRWLHALLLHSYEHDAARAVLRAASPPKWLLRTPAKAAPSPHPAPAGDNLIPESIRRPLDAALRARSLRKARKTATETRLPSAVVALRALELGYAELARKQANWTLAADPRNTDASVVLLLLTARSADVEAPRISVPKLPINGTPPSEYAQAVLWKYLEQHGLLLQWPSATIDPPAGL